MYVDNCLSRKPSIYSTYALITVV